MTQQHQGQKAQEFQEKHKRYVSHSPDAIADLEYSQTHPQYPAHPGPRSPRLYRNLDSTSSTVSPVLTRGPSGDQIQIFHRKKEKEKEIDRGVMEGSEASGSGSGSGTTAVEEGKLEDELEGSEVREWATRINNRGDELDAEGHPVSPGGTHDFDPTVLGHG